MLVTVALAVRTALLMAAETLPDRINGIQQPIANSQQPLREISVPMRPDRRSFLKAGSAGLVMGALGLRSSATADETPSPYGSFKMGMASYSVRNWKTLDEVLARAQELEIKYVELNPRHITPTADAGVISAYKKKLDDAHITALAFGVFTFADDVKANRRAFEFAQAMGMYTISADFDPKATLSLDRLCEEFPNVHVGIHNHGPKSRYQTPEDVLACIKDHHKNIGATADLGHYIRSKQDPLEVIEKLKERLYGIHFKDYKFDAQGKDIETIPGDGTLKIRETLSLLKKCNYQGCISLEYESNEHNPVPDMKKALEAVRAAIKEI